MDAGCGTLLRSRCRPTRTDRDRCVASESHLACLADPPHLEDLMADASDSPLSIRAALHRKALADARQRVALARRLGFTESEVLAIQHLARAGELTPGQLGAQLQLSSGAPPP